MSIGYRGDNIFEIGNISVLLDYEVGRSSKSPQESPPDRLGFLREIQVTGVAY